MSVYRILWLALLPVIQSLKTIPNLPQHPDPALPALPDVLDPPSPHDLPALPGSSSGSPEIFSESSTEDHRSASPHFVDLTDPSGSISNNATTNATTKVEDLFASVYSADQYPAPNQRYLFIMEKL